jgi:hypothetical protein
MSEPQLSASVAAVASRLARELEGLPGLGDDSRAFLHRMGAAEPPADAGAPLERLALGLQLSRLELELLLLAGLPEEHEGYAALLREVHPEGEPRPTIGLAARLFCSGEAERGELREVVETGRAVAAGVLVVEEHPPFFERGVRTGEALWSALHGIDSWPRTVHVRPAVNTRGLEDWLTTSTPARAIEALRRGLPCTILLSADSAEVALDRGAALVESSGERVVCISPAPDAIPLACAHALVRDAVPVIGLTPADEPARLSEPDLGMFPGPVVLCIRAGTVSLAAERPVIAIDVEPLPAAARRRLWLEALPELAEHAPALAARGVVEPAFAQAAAADVRMLGTLDGGVPDARTVGAAVRARAGLSLAGGVKLVHPTATWDSLVLPAETTKRLHEAANRLRYQTRVLDDWRFLAGRPGARGVRVLLSGPPGTGKTLSAEVLAHELGVDLLVVDIARIVSKWIGETEKNLAEVFDAAERSQAVLFFDEADALFGRRTEVSDAHDRYANLETAYLLTRLERFEGLAVLSTNLYQNIDAAFIRRLEFVIELEEPTPAEREALWRCHLPEEAPLADDVDVPALAARYPLVGGLIRNAAVAAGFLAAANGGAITVAHLEGALRREYEKSGRPFPASTQ